MAATALCAGRRACGGPGLPVRRCRLRGVRGERRPSHRRAPPHGASGTLARRCTCPTHARAALARVMREAIRRNRVTRRPRLSAGDARRRPSRFPVSPTPRPPTLVCLARSITPGGDATRQPGIAVKSMPDIRWQRCDIKTVMLLPACLAKEAAQGRGARGLVRRHGRICHRGRIEQCLDRRFRAVITRPLGPDILPGVTRATFSMYQRGGYATRSSGRSRLPRPDAPGSLHYLGNQSVMPVVPSMDAPSATANPGRRAAAAPKFHQFAVISIGNNRFFLTADVNI